VLPGPEKVGKLEINQFDALVFNKLGYFGWCHRWLLSVIDLLYASILEVLTAKLHVAEQTRKEILTTGLGQQKVCSFALFQHFKPSFSHKRPVRIQRQGGPFLEDLDH
jgi:hypothetical protein